jgi:hypothetical protein
MAHKMKPAEIREFRAAFDHFDKNGDGTINVQELKEVMKSMGKNPTVEELRGKLRQFFCDIIYSTLLDAARRCSTLLDAARRCSTLLDAARR